MTDEVGRRDFLTAGLLATAAGGLAPVAYALENKPTSPPSQAAAFWKDKVVVITGGSSGIGKQAVFSLSALGAKVCFLGKTDAKGKDVEREAKARGGNAVFVRTDITVPAEVDSFFKKLDKDFGRLDIAMNFAGISEHGHEFAKEPINKFSEVIQTNLIGTMACLQQEVELMLRGGGGSIVSVLSAVVHSANMHLPAYTASKYGLLGLTKALAKRYTKEGIRINAVSPGLVDHDMGSSDDDVAADYALPRRKMLANGRLITKNEVVQSMMWLCTSSASGINGENIFIDAGG